MSTVSKMVTVHCIDCEQPIRLTFKPVVGQIINCSSCQAELEVIGINPLEVDWAYFEPEEEEDWSWDEEEEDYDDDDDDWDDDDLS